MKWIRKLFGLCEHNWHVMGQMSIITKVGHIPSGVLYVMQCKHCGNIKTKKVTG